MKNIFSILILIIIGAGVAYYIYQPKKSNPLITAVSKNDLKHVKKLLSEGISPNVRDDKGHTPLLLAVRNGNKEITETLILAGADVNAQSKRSKWSPLFKAAYYGHADIAQLLKKHGADPTIKNIHGQTAADIARQQKQHHALPYVS